MEAESSKRSDNARDVAANEHVSSRHLEQMQRIAAHGNDDTTCLVGQLQHRLARLRVEHGGKDVVARKAAAARLELAEPRVGLH